MKLLLLLTTLFLTGGSFADEPRRFRAWQVYGKSEPFLFHPDHAEGGFDLLALSVDGRHGIAEPEDGRVEMVDAPGMSGETAILFTVEPASGVYRSEIALPSEDVFAERWYQVRMQIPEVPQAVDGGGADIVVQWHAVPGDWRPTFPNLVIALEGDRWWIKRSYGDPKTKPVRTKTELEQPLEVGRWITWTIHANWSPDEDGHLPSRMEGREVAASTRKCGASASLCVGHHGLQRGTRATLSGTPRT